MKKSNIAMVLGAVIAVVTSCSVASAQMLVDTQDGIELWSIPQPSPGAGLVATKIVFQTVDSAGTDIVTYDGLQITGQLHQVAFPGRQTTPTPSLQTFDDEGGFFDSWLSLIYGRLRKETGEAAYGEKQLLYFHRSLCQITGPQMNGADGRRVPAKAFPESYNTLVEGENQTFAPLHSFCR